MSCGFYKANNKCFEKSFSFIDNYCKLQTNQAGPPWDIFLTKPRTVEKQENRPKPGNNIYLEIIYCDNYSVVDSKI